MNRFRLFAVLGILALTGCTSVGNSTSLFLLDHSYPSRGDQQTEESRPLLIVEPVSVAPYLDASGIAYQTAPYRVTVANQNRWASPLPAQLTDGLYAALAGELDGINVVRGDQRGAGTALRLKIHVNEFMGHFDGTAHVTGQWTLVDRNDKQLARQQFERRVPLNEDGYAELVASLSRGWRQISEAMGPAIAGALERSEVSR